MTLDGLAAAIARATHTVQAYVSDGFHPRPFILGIAVGLIAPTAVRLLSWVL